MKKILKTYLFMLEREHKGERQEEGESQADSALKHRAQRRTPSQDPDITT